MQKNPKPHSGKPSVSIQNSVKTANPPNPPNPVNPAHSTPGTASSLPSGPNTDSNFENELKFPEARRGSYRAALAITGRIIPLPIIVAFITALFYISPLNGLPVIGTSIIGGVVITVIIWFITSIFCMELTTFAGANEQSSNHLKRHLLTLYTILHT